MITKKAVYAMQKQCMAMQGYAKPLPRLLCLLCRAMHGCVRLCMAVLGYAEASGACKAVQWLYKAMQSIL